MHHAGAGVIATAAPGRLAQRLAPHRASSSAGHALRFAQRLPSGAHHSIANCNAPSAIVAATHGTTARFASRRIRRELQKDRRAERPGAAAASPASGQPLAHACRQRDVRFEPSFDRGGPGEDRADAREGEREGRRRRRFAGAANATTIAAMRARSKKTSRVRAREPPAPPSPSSRRAPRVAARRSTSESPDNRRRRKRSSTAATRHTRATTCRASQPPRGAIRQ